MSSSNMHPFRHPDNSPKLQDVIDVMEKVPAFNDVTTKIKDLTTKYVELEKQRLELIVQEGFNPITETTGWINEDIERELKETTAALTPLNEEGKALIGQYLQIFFNEYKKHDCGQLRTWSFPKVVWQHYQNMVSHWFDYSPNQPPAELFSTDGLTLLSPWSFWARDHHDIPPFLKIVDQTPIYDRNNYPTEWEMQKVNGDGQLIQEIYQVRCGPRLCGTRISGIPNTGCNHPDRVYQFTKRPVEWVAGQGWAKGNPFQAQHQPFAFQNEKWDPFYKLRWPTPFVRTSKMVPKRDPEYLEFYEDLSEDPERWLSRIPAEASVFPPV